MSLFFASPALAAIGDAPVNKPGSSTNQNTTSTTDTTDNNTTNGGINQVLVTNQATNSEEEEQCKTDGHELPQDFVDKCLQQNKFLQLIKKIINFFTIGVGVIVTIMIVIGGIQYSLSKGDSGAVASAKKRIVNALLALLAFIFLRAFLEWIIPGGIF